MEVVRRKRKQLRGSLMIGDNSVVIIVQERDVTKLEVTSIPVLRLTSRG